MTPATPRIMIITIHVNHATCNEVMAPSSTLHNVTFSLANFDVTKIVRINHNEREISQGSLQAVKHCHEDGFKQSCDWKTRMRRTNSRKLTKSGK